MLQKYRAKLIEMQKKFIAPFYDAMMHTEGVRVEIGGGFTPPPIDLKHLIWTSLELNLISSTPLYSTIRIFELGYTAIVDGNGVPFKEEESAFIDVLVSDNRNELKMIPKFMLIGRDDDDQDQPKKVDMTYWRDVILVALTSIHEEPDI